MYPDGTLERFDENFVVGVHPNLITMMNPESGLLGPQKFGGRGTLDDLYHYVEESLRTYQSYWVPQDFGDPWRGFLPNAFLLEKGMKLVNIETKAEYTIDEVAKSQTGKSTGEVRLRGESGSEPTAIDHLELDAKNRIRFSRVSKRSDDIDFEEGATRKDTPRPWNAYIDFAVVEEEEASSEPGSPRPVTIGRKRMLRETIESTEPQLTHQVYGQWLDARVRFDLWGATESQAESLVYWFYDYVRLNSWIYKLNGVKEFQFRRRGMDQPIGKWRQALYHRAIDYFVRTEHLFTAQFRKLEHITLYMRKRKLRVLEQGEVPVTGRPTFAGEEIPVTVVPSET